jgi:hypothetical protein
MNGLIAFLYIVLCMVILFAIPVILPPAFVDFYGAFTFFDGAKALMLCGVASFGVFLFLASIKEDRHFLLQLFFGALLYRILIAAIVFSTNTQGFFGGDAYTYDTLGLAQIGAWGGSSFDAGLVARFTGTSYSGSGWGMLYYVAVIYSLIGRNMLATQLLNSVAGAFTAPVIFLISEKLFGHKGVSRLAALAVAFFPSMALWSAQGIKDGPIIFLLAISMLATLRLSDKFDPRYFMILIFALFALLTLRFYIFYMAVVAIGLTFLIGNKAFSAQSILRQLILVVAMAVAFSYLGVSKFANAQLEAYGSLETVQNARSNLANSAESGFGQDVNVSTTGGVLSAIPIGMTYLLLAPFPWQMGSLRSLITFPEMVVWWSSMPLLVLGIWYAMKFRLRRVAPILVFVSMLTVAYSVTQGNVGTAYRQRSQLLLFYLIFVAVGYYVMREKRGDRRAAKGA